MTAIVDICARTNIDFRRVFTVFDNNNRIRGDLANSELRMQFRRSPDARLVAWQVGTNPAVGGLAFFREPRFGEIVLRIKHEVLDRTLGPGTFYHDLIEVTPLGQHKDLWTGKLILTQGITR